MKLHRVADSPVALATPRGLMRLQPLLFLVALGIGLINALIAVFAVFAASSHFDAGTPAGMRADMTRLWHLMQTTVAVGLARDTAEEIIAGSGYPDALAAALIALRNAAAPLIWLEPDERQDEPAQRARDVAGLITGAVRRWLDTQPRSSPQAALEVARRVVQDAPALSERVNQVATSIYARQVGPETRNAAGSFDMLLWLLASTTLFGTCVVALVGIPHLVGAQPAAAAAGDSGDLPSAHRLFLQNVTSRLLMRSSEKSARCAVLVIGVDNLQAVAGAHGRSVADAALMAVAQCLAANVRASDIVGHAGGNGFAVVLSEIDPEVVMRTSRRIRDAIARLEIAIANNGRLAISASIGIAISDSDAPMESVVERAHAAQQRAAATGPRTITVD